MRKRLKLLLILVLFFLFFPLAHTLITSKVLLVYHFTYFHLQTIRTLVIVWHSFCFGLVDVC